MTGETGSGGSGAGGCGEGGCGSGCGGGGHVRTVSIETLSLTETPPAVPLTAAVFGTTVGVHSAGAVVLREQP
jgi:hypothetical protein